MFKLSTTRQSKAIHRPKRRFTTPLFETLDSRQMMSVTMPAQDSTVTHRPASAITYPARPTPQIGDFALLGAN